MAELTVAAGIALGLMDFAVSKGAERNLLSARANIPLKDLQDYDARIAFSKYVALMRAGKELCDDPALALHFGAAVDLAEFSVVGLINTTAESLVDGLAQLNRYGRLVVEFEGGKDRFGIKRDARGLWLVDNRQNPDEFFELTESTFARFISGPKQRGVTQVAKAVHVTHKAPSYRAEYERVYGAPVTFESHWNAILIDEKWLTYKLAGQPRYVFGILAGHADALLKKLENSQTARGRVETLLIPVLHTGNTNMKWVAGKMGTSRQTLFRRLKAEGTTFELVLDELRKTLAIQYLNSRKVSVNQTAYLVGFSDAAAFSRAFKRWTGSRPKSLRDSPSQQY